MANLSWTLIFDTRDEEGAIFTSWGLGQEPCGEILGVFYCSRRFDRCDDMKRGRRRTK